MSESHLQSRGFVLDPGQALLWVLDSCARIARISAAVCVAEVTLISSECCFAALHNLIDVDVDERLKDRSICEYRWGYEEQQVSWCCLVLCYFTERRMRELDMFKPTSSLTSHWYSLISFAVVLILIIPARLDFYTAANSGIFVRIASLMCIFVLVQQ